MLAWPALLGLLICLAAIAARNLGLDPGRASSRAPAWTIDALVLGLAALALALATRPAAPNLLATLPFVAASLTWAWAFDRRSAAFVGLIVACSLTTGFGQRGVDPLAALPTAATIASVALVERASASAGGRWAWALAGGLLGYASLAASWPITFALAALATQLVDRGALQRSTLPFALGFALTGLLTALLPAHAPSGHLLLVDACGDDRAIGLRWLFALDGNLDRGERFVEFPAKLAHLRERAAWLWGCAGALLVPALVCLRAVEPARFMAIAGCTALLALWSVDASAWTVACVLVAGRAPVLRDRPRTLACAGLLALDLALLGLARVHPEPPFLANVGATSLLTLLVLGLGLLALLDPRLRDDEGPA